MKKIILTDELLNAALSIAKRAGELLLTFYYQDIGSELKQDNTPVTVADLAVSRFLIDELQGLTPGIPVLSEESQEIDFAERKQWQQYWLVDPLDGTQQFLQKTDLNAQQSSVAFLLLTGLSKNMIQAQLSISDAVVKDCIKSIYQYFSVHSLDELIKSLYNQANLGIYLDRQVSS